jgi:hypothetical protein
MPRVPPVCTSSTRGMELSIRSCRDLCLVDTSLPEPSSYEPSSMVTSRPPRPPCADGDGMARNDTCCDAPNRSSSGSTWLSAALLCTAHTTTLALAASDSTGI